MPNIDKNITHYVGDDCEGHHYNENSVVEMTIRSLRERLDDRDQEIEILRESLNLSVARIAKLEAFVRAVTDILEEGEPYIYHTQIEDALKDLREIKP